MMVVLRDVYNRHCSLRGDWTVRMQEHIGKMRYPWRMFPWSGAGVMRREAVDEWGI